MEIPERMKDSGTITMKQEAVDEARNLTAGFSLGGWQRSDRKS
jgi:hypothetical protein